MEVMFSTTVLWFTVLTELVLQFTSVGRRMTPLHTKIKEILPVIKLLVFKFNVHYFLLYTLQKNLNLLMEP